MFANRRAFMVVLLFVLALSAACGGPTEFEPTVSPAESTAVAQAPQMGPITPSGPSEVRDLSTTTEVVPNCDGVTSPVVKHPSMTVGSSQTVEWQVGTTVGTGVTIGGGVVPSEVNLQVALEGRVVNDLANHIQQGNAWELPADPGTIMEYTIMWREVWQPAYLDVTFMDPEPAIIKIDVKYRTGVQSEIVGSKATPCDPGALTQVEPATAEPAPAETPAPPDMPAQPDCPFLTNSHIEQLRTTASVSDAIQQAEAFAGHQQNDYKEGATIPAGVVIATDLQNSDLSAFPVSPVRNQGGWGLFVTTDAFAAPNSGTYWCIR